MKRSSKLIISLMAIVCVVALMATGVHAATNASFSIVNSVIYIFQGNKITVTFYAGNAIGVPTADNVIDTISRSDGTAIGDDVPQNNSNENYKFLGWFTYNFEKGEWGTKLYDSTTIVSKTDATSNKIALFEKYGAFTGSTGGVVIAPSQQPTEIPELGISIKVVNGQVTIVGSISGATNVTIPSSIVDSNGNEIKITQITAGSNWENVESLDFSKPSNITDIKYNAMEGLEKLKTVILPAGLTNVNGLALGNLVSLEWMVIPLSVTNLRYHAFTEVPASAVIYCEVLEDEKVGWTPQWLYPSGEMPTILWGIGVTWDYDTNGVPKPL